MGYGWGRMYFWGGLLISFIISVIGIFVYNKIKSRRKTVILSKGNL
jgi:hypothetical protein